MRSPVLVGLMALSITASGLVGAASAQPRPPHHDREREHARYNPPPPPPGWNQRQWDYRQRYVYRYPERRDDHSDAIIAGVLGFVLGAAIAGSQQEQQAVRSRLEDPNWIAYCARKYRSFDPNSGTYLGYDGLRHYCR